MANETTLENKITEAGNSQIAGNTTVPEAVPQPPTGTQAKPVNTEIQTPTNTEPINNQGNSVEEKIAKLEAAEKRIDLKLAELNKVDIGGESTVEQTLTKEEKITKECNDFLEGTGLKI